MGIFITFLSAIVFGFYPPASRAFYLEGGNVSALMLVTSAIRFICLLLYCKLKDFKFLPRPREKKSIFLAGFYQSLSNIALLSSLAFLPGPIAITIIFTHTIMLLIFLVLRGEKKLTTVVFFSTFASLIGISLVVGFWKTKFEFNITGVGLAFVAAVASVIRLYSFEKEVAKNDPILVGARVFAVVLLISTIFALWERPSLPPNLYGNMWLLVSALSLTCGTFCMFWAIKLIGSFKFSLFIKVEPIFTSMFSFLLLGEVLSFDQYLGMVIVISSLSLYQVFEGSIQKVKSG